MAESDYEKEEGQRKEVSGFFLAVWTTWEGIVGTIFGLGGVVVYQNLGGVIVSWLVWLVATVALGYAFYRAWRDQYRKVRELEKKLEAKAIIKKIQNELARHLFLGKELFNESLNQSLDQNVMSQKCQKWDSDVDTFLSGNLDERARVKFAYVEAAPGEIIDSYIRCVMRAKTGTLSEIADNVEKYLNL